jgi:hypothetical protein
MRVVRIVGTAKTIVGYRVMSDTEAGKIAAQVGLTEPV